MDAAALAAFRPSYRMLAYALGRGRYTVAGDLYGGDQSDGVAELRRAALAWTDG